MCASNARDARQRVHELDREFGVMGLQSCPKVRRTREIRSDQRGFVSGYLPTKDSQITTFRYFIIY